MRNSFKQIGVFLLSAAFGAVTMALFMLGSRYLGIQPPDWLTIFAILIVIIVLAVAIHEAGHFIAGKAVGLKFYMLSVGPVKFQLRGESIRLELNQNLNIVGGLTIMLPEIGQFNESKSAQFWYLAGGIIANIITSFMLFVLVAVLIVNSLVLPESFLTYTLYTTAYINMLIGVTALIPSNSGALESDGIQLLDLHRGGIKSVIKQRIMALLVSIWNGGRPREMNKAELDNLLELTQSNTDSNALSIRLLAFSYHLDNGAIDLAESFLDELIECVEQQKNIIIEGTVFSEKAFVLAAFRSDSETAQLFLDKAKKGYTEEFTIAKAEAAILVLNSKIEEAIDRAKEGLIAAEKSISKGSSVFEIEMLTALSNGKLPDLKQTNQHSIG